MESPGNEIGGLNLYDLSRFGIPRDVLDALVFEHGGDPTLLDMQLKGVLAGVCDPARLLHKSGVISGPTSCGKTVLAELRMLVRYFEGRRKAQSESNAEDRKVKTIYLVPTRAIGLEKREYFDSLYGKFEMGVFYSDGDVRDHDGDILRGKFDLAVIVNEKLKFFILHSRDFLKQVGEVVIDEIGLVSDRSRGPGLETTLAGLLLSPCKPTILALTTPLQDAGRLAELLNGFLVEEEMRPVDIRAGIWGGLDRQFESWSCNTLEAYPPELIDLGCPRDRDKTLKELVLRYKSGIMLALPTKDLVYGYAGSLYRLAGTDAEVRDILTDQTDAGLVDQRMKGLEGTRGKEFLLKYMKAGIGLHHADLAPAERKEVECAFRNREIAVVLCTSTLARGVNLPAQAVVFLDWGDAYVTGDTSAPCYGQLAHEFGSWVGRAGRVGKCMGGTPEAIYIAQTRSERKWIERLLHARKMGLSPHLADSGLAMEDVVLSASVWLQTHAAQSKPANLLGNLFGMHDLRDFFTHTLSAQAELAENRIMGGVTSAVVRLTNPRGGEPFIQAKRILGRSLQTSASKRAANLLVSAADLQSLLTCLGELRHVSSDAAETAMRIKKEIASSILAHCQRVTVRRLQHLLHRLELHQDINRVLATAAKADGRCVAMTVDDFSRSIKIGAKPASVDGPSQDVRIIRDKVYDLAWSEPRLLCDTACSAAPRLPGPYSLPTQIANELLTLLDREDVVSFFLRRPSATAGEKTTVPSYLKWVENGDDTGFQLTPLGKICCSHGISVSTCAQLFSWAGLLKAKAGDRKLEVADLLDRLLGTSDGQKINLLQTDPAVRAGELEDTRAGEASIWAKSASRNRLSTVMAMKDWQAGVPSIDIENKYGVYGGSLYEISRHLSRLVQAFADIAAEVLRNSPDNAENGECTATKSGVTVPDDLKPLAETLLNGVPSEALPIARLGVDGLSRGWAMTLWHGLEKEDDSQRLPVIERLQQIDQDRLREMLPTRGLAQRLADKLADRSKDLLAANLVARRDFLIGYYLLPQVVKAQLDRGQAHYGRHPRNMAVRMTTADGHHVVLRRNEQARCPVRIETEQELLQWVKLGAVDFYGEIAEQIGGQSKGEEAVSQTKEPRFVTDRFFVDLDPQNGYPMDRLKAVAERVHALFSHLPQVNTTNTYWSGGKGFHIVGAFREGLSLDIQEAKQRLSRLLTSGGICNDSDIFLGDDPTNLEPHLILDLSSMMRRGLYRNELSIHAVSGGCCVQVDIARLASFDPACEASPEAVRGRLLDQLTKRQKEDYAGRVVRVLQSDGVAFDDYCGIDKSSIKPRC